MLKPFKFPAEHWRAYLISALIVVGVTLICLPGRSYFAKGQWALLYLLAIVFVAGFYGVRSAVLASVLAFLGWNYFFLPPYHTLRINDPKDWLSLLVFLVVGVIMGLQTGRIRERETQALERERETALLNRFGAQLVSDISVQDMVDTLVEEVANNTRASNSAVFVRGDDGSVNCLCGPSVPGCRHDAALTVTVGWAMDQAKAIGLPSVSPGGHRPEGWPVSVDHSAAGLEVLRLDMFIPLQTAANQIGVLYVGEPKDKAPYTIAEARLLVALANQAAAFLERSQLRGLAIQADALREADQLKSTFISSVSHELKTPLASITATITNLLESDFKWDEETLRDELAAVKSDLDRLNGSITALLDLSRLEAAAWEPKREQFDLSDILWTALSRIPQKQKSRVEVSLPESLPMIYVDFVQWSRALENLLTNALAYSPENSQVSVGASVDDRVFRIWVEDEGPGIRPDEREKIFGKFYRGEASSRSSSGTGLGLAVTREIVRFHGGRIWVEDVQPHGARFVISLPVNAPSPLAGEGPGEGRTR